MEINGLAYLASGSAPHPTLVICHDWPGHEKNLDLGQAVRRTGWNAITFNYRGSWGSPGEFHFSQMPEDVRAVVTWLRTPEVARNLAIDVRHIVVAGHGVGGWATAQMSTVDPMLSGVILIAPIDIAALGTMSRADLLKTTSLNAQSLAASAEAMADELVAHADAFALARTAPGLARLPVLVLTANDGLAPSGDALVAAVRTHNSVRVQLQHFTTDASWSDSRIALQSTVINWLQALPMTK